MKKSIPSWLAEELEKKGGLEKIIGSIPDQNILRKKAKVYGALNEPIRLKILCFLGKQSSCVCLIREIVNISYSKLSYHLSIMKRAGLIKGKKDKNYVIYSLTELGRKYYKEICEKE